jgi:cell division initiation protein
MIDLTPLDVRKKKEDFKRSMRGYDPEQVDSFLQIVADRLEELIGLERTLGERVDSLEDQLNRYQERERALNEALLAAQELREEARSQAERDAALRMREAETHAEAILLDADQAIRQSQRRLDDMRARRGHLMRSLRGLLERFSEYLDLEEARLDAEPDDLTDLVERLEGDIVRELKGEASSAEDVIEREGERPASGRDERESKEPASVGGRPETEEPSAATGEPIDEPVSSPAATSEPETVEPETVKPETAYPSREGTG